MKSLIFKIIFSILLLSVTCINLIKCDSTSNTSLNYFYKSKFSIEDLWNSKFTFNSSNDSDMDPCKSGN